MTTNFILDLLAIGKAIAELLELIENLDIDLDLDQSFFDIDDIIRGLQINNLIQRSTFEASKSIAKFIDNNFDLLNVNKSRVAKAKERSVKARNKKNTIIKAEKAKTKSIKKDLFDFEHVDATIKVSRDSKRAIGRDGGRDKARQKKQKKLEASIVAAIDANIQIFNKDVKEIHEDIRDIITRQTTRRATKKATTIFAISAIFAIIKTTIKKIIQVDNNNEFDADDNNNANSNNN